jgi:hypothetical protein
LRLPERTDKNDYGDKKQGKCTICAAKKCMNSELYDNQGSPEKA